MTRGIRHLLPATPHEIAAVVGCTVHQAHARLWNLKKRGAARPGNRVPNGNTGRGPHYTRIWHRC
jgi:hypothetical protein